MDKKPCAPGKKYDILVKRCKPIKTGPKPAAPPSTGPLPPVVQVRATSQAPEVPSMMVRSPALWLFVVLVTLLSVLVLALWIISRKHCRTSRTPDAKQQQELLQKAEPPVTHVYNNHAAAMGPTPWTHLRPRAQTGPEQQEAFYAHRDPPEHAGMEEEEGGLCSCCTAREHRVPLPATELGGTVLVTTKTV